LLVALLRRGLEFFANCSQLFESPILFRCPGLSFSFRALMCFLMSPEPRCRFFGALALFFLSPAQGLDFRGERLLLLDQLAQLGLRLLLHCGLFTQRSFGFIDSLLLFLLSDTERINPRAKGFFLGRPFLGSSLSLASEYGQFCQPDFVLLGAHFCFDPDAKMRFFLGSQIGLGLAQAFALFLLLGPKLFRSDDRQLMSFFLRAKFRLDLRY
jgi:hypothetical protein